MVSQDFYAQQLNRKRPWTPVCGDPLPVVEGAQEMIGRAMSLRVLELEVGEWIATATRSELPISESAMAVLRSNILDEANHDKVLSMAAERYKLCSVASDAAANQFYQAWVSHPDHPLVKAFVLENSIFFVLLPLLRMFGGVGLAIIAGDISNDESVHAAVHRQLCRDLNMTYSPSLDRLRRETASWLVETLRIGEAGRKGSPKFWMDQSDSLLYNGTADLTETRRAMMPAFFEIENPALPSYA